MPSAETVPSASDPLPTPASQGEASTTAVAPVAPLIVIDVVAEINGEEPQKSEVSVSVPTVQD